MNRRLHNEVALVVPYLKIICLGVEEALLILTVKSVSVRNHLEGILVEGRSLFSLSDGRGELNVAQREFVAAMHPHRQPGNCAVTARGIIHILSNNFERVITNRKHESRKTDEVHAHRCCILCCVRNKRAVGKHNGIFGADRYGKVNAAFETLGNRTIGKHSLRKRIVHFHIDTLLIASKSRIVDGNSERIAHRFLLTVRPR